jgi:hypothetical protein
MDVREGDKTCMIYYQYYMCARAAARFPRVYGKIVRETAKSDKRSGVRGWLAGRVELQPSRWLICCTCTYDRTVPADPN